MTKLIAFTLGLLFIVGCAGHQVESGFLGPERNYAFLTPSEDDQDLRYWLLPQVEHRAPAYTKVFVDHVIMWNSLELADNSGLEPDELEELRVHFESCLHKALEDGYTVVDQPEPGALRIGAAITDIEDSMPLLTTITSLLPIAIVINAAHNAATGENTLVGGAEVEMRFYDASTGEMLAMFMDRTAGDRYAKASFSSLGHARAAMEDWAVFVREQMDALNGMTPEQKHPTMARAKSTQNPLIH